MDLFFEIFSIAPSVIQWIVFIIIVISILAISVFLVIGAYRFSNAVAKETRIFDLAKVNNELVNKNKDYENNMDDIKSSIESINNFMLKTTEDIRELYTSLIDANKPEKTRLSQLENMVYETVYELINIIASDIGYNNRKRVSLWSKNSEDETILESLNRSANFPDSKDYTKHLDINKSIAGRALRTKSIQKVYDLKNDPDWNNYSTNQQYEVIIAFPIDGKRVMTIDYRKPPNAVEVDLLQTVVNNLSFLYSYNEHAGHYLQLLDYLDEEIEE